MATPYTNPAVRKAMTLLEQLSADEEICRMAKEREKFLRELFMAQEAGRAHGREEGQQEERLVIAKKALQEGLPIDLILKLTGLAPEALAQLRAAAQPPQA